MYQVPDTDIYINPATVVAVMFYENIDTFCVKTNNGQLFNIPVSLSADFMDAVDKASGGGGGGEPITPPEDYKTTNHIATNVQHLYDNWNKREGEEVDLSSLPQDDII